MSDSEGYKIVILGDGRVGKTSLISRYFYGKFSETEASTVNASNLTKTFKYQGKDVKVSFWDTAGQEIFKSLNKLYYQNATGAIIVYDLTNFESFQRVEEWVKTLREVNGKDITFILLGNKFDLLGKDDRVNKAAEIDAYCQREGCKHFYTSAKTGYQVNEAFETLVNNVFIKIKPGQGGKKGRRELVLTNENNQDGNGKKGGCC